MQSVKEPAFDLMPVISGNYKKKIFMGAGGLT